ncbi:hypothetical protein LAZ67_17003129 [Cordylochernes scorpioides]|uniref:Uncharacterized protein n=1 Tax=Cordylochernes scorpioides TaxID=51811 RepID=A0ABY6LEF4_9ARAC|nr:hypothetical protein LAZ67_17003129 [Cordylochernes scorpioides]
MNLDCFSNDNHRVWLRLGDRSNPAVSVKRRTSRQRGIMVHKAIPYDSRSPLIRIENTMTAQRYLDDVLRPVMLPFFQSNDNHRVWLRLGDRSNPAVSVKRRTSRQRGIMVHKAIPYDSRSPLIRIENTMTAQRYLDDVLRPVMLPFFQRPPLIRIENTMTAQRYLDAAAGDATLSSEVPNVIFQQDNARPHTTHISQHVLYETSVLPCPPVSSELPPIEHISQHVLYETSVLPCPPVSSELPPIEHISQHVLYETSVLPCPPVSSELPPIEHISQHVLYETSVLPCPPVSSDLPPIEHISQHVLYETSVLPCPPVSSELPPIEHISQHVLYETSVLPCPPVSSELPPIEHISQHVLYETSVLPCPPVSSDLSLIKHVWDVIGRRLRALPQLHLLDEHYHR